MEEKILGEARDHEFQEVSPTRVPPQTGLSVNDIRQVQLEITAELGHCVMPVREILQLKRGTVIQLDKQAGEMTEIHVNGMPLARGEIVVIGDILHVRVAEVLGAVEKGEEGGDAGASEA